MTAQSFSSNAAGVFIKMSMSAVAWFLAVIWLNFAKGPSLDLKLEIATGVFVMVLTFILLTASSLVGEPRHAAASTTRA